MNWVRKTRAQKTLRMVITNPPRSGLGCSCSLHKTRSAPSFICSACAVDLSKRNRKSALSIGPLKSVRLKPGVVDRSVLCFISPPAMFCQVSQSYILTPSAKWRYRCGRFTELFMMIATTHSSNCCGSTMNCCSYASFSTKNATWKLHPALYRS